MKCVHAKIIDTAIGTYDGVMQFYIQVFTDDDHCFTFGMACSTSGIECMSKIIEAVGVNRWEDLRWRYIWIKGDPDESNTFEIKGINTDSWLDLTVYLNKENI